VEMGESEVNLPKKTSSRVNKRVTKARQVIAEGLFLFLCVVC
jgi:hypothetical protein